MRKKERWQAWSNRSPSSPAEWSPHRDLPAEDLKSCHPLGSDSRTGLSSTASGGKHQLSPACVSSWTEENTHHKQKASASSSSPTRCQLRGRSSWCHLQHPHLPETTWRQQPAWALWEGEQCWQGEFEEHIGRSVPKTEVTVDLTGQHCQKSLSHRLNDVRRQQNCQVLESPGLQASPPQTYRERGKKLLHLFVVAKERCKCRNTQIRALPKPAAESLNVAMPNAKSFITAKFPAASLENELFLVTKAKLSHAKVKKKKKKRPNKICCLSLDQRLAEEINHHTKWHFFRRAIDYRVICHF